jgi:SAM-dependent methyltransferase
MASETGEALPAADGTPRADDREAIEELRRVLERTGYTAAGVREALATEVTTGRDSAELPLYLRLLDEDDPLSTLIKLFLLGVPATPADAAAALAPIPLDRLEAAGAIAVVDNRVEPRLELMPTEELLIACDPYQGEVTRRDHVLGVSPPARVLAALTVRLPVERALDLGTGNGLQALFAARHARHVVAVDVNRRALAFAAFNAVLNGAPGIELRGGDLFEPVEGSTFDLIVTNPPYVISPESAFTYRDGGLPGDAFCERLVRQLPRFLAEGGFAHALVSWLHPTDTEWSEPLRRWVEGSGCDALLLRYTTHEPLSYAAGWNRPLRADAAAYGDALDRWSEYYRGLGVEAISWGAVVLRRRSAARNWVFAYSPSSERITGASDHVLRLFAAQDFLEESGTNQSLLAHSFTLVEDHQVEQLGRLREGGTHVERIVLENESGLRFKVSLDPSSVDVLSRLDGSRPLRDVLRAASGSAPAGTTAEEFERRALPVVRRLVELGFAVPAPDTPLQSAIV